MTESNNTASNNWRSKQIWIKDVLSKSGTELMEITRTSNQRSNPNITPSIAPITSVTNTGITQSTTLINIKNGVGKKLVKKSNDKESQTKMVYYSSTPLIVKTEHPSQTQFCTRTPQLTTSTTLSTPATTIGLQHHQLLPMHQHQQQQSHQQNAQSYGINHANDAILLQQQSITLPHNNSSNSNPNQQQQQSQNFLLANIKTEQLPPSITLYATTTATTTAIATSAAQHTTAPITTISSISGGGSNVGRKSSTTGGANKPQFKCEQCGMIFGSKSAHTSHTKSHAKSGELNILGSGIGGAAAIASTAITQTNIIEVNDAGVPVGIPKMPQITPNANAASGGGDPYQCNVCQKTFAVPARLIRHYRTHTGERPFECEFCHKLFSVKENLQVHRRIHTKERPYKCDVCGRAFEHSGKLHRHMRIHTGERPHKCSVCEKTFIQSGQLVIHMRTHTGEKPYKCPVEGCGKGFTCSKQLKVHSRTHTGEKPYHCDICFRDFGYNHVLKLHRVQHYGSKCYKCTICDKTFKSKKEMEAHIKGHANEMPDDDEEGGGAGSAVGSGQTSSLSSSGGDTTNSAPGSPQSPGSSTVTVVQQPQPPKPRKPRQPRAPRINNKPPPSPSSPSSTYSPPSSFASASRLSAGSPSSSVASPAGIAVGSFAANTSVALTLETEMQYNSRDSGHATSFSTASSSQRAAMLTSKTPASYNNIDEMPTDLSIGQQHMQTKASTNNFYHQQQSAAPSTYPYLRRHSPTPITEAPTINPALLEAASIASEEEVTQAALQIMQLQHNTKRDFQKFGGGKGDPAVSVTGQSARKDFQQFSITSNMQHQQSHHIPAAAHAVFVNNTLIDSSLAQQDDDAREANELIEHYKRGELGRHGLHKRYAPVPKFESTLLNNEIIVRQVEAAIAPLRSSTESPERSSSPESDSIMLVGDRDVMTLPLRKRKLYMQDRGEKDSASEAIPNHGNSNGTSDANVTNQKVMRMSSVIQFAKAS